MNHAIEQTSLDDLDIIIVFSNKYILGYLGYNQ
jgi:hypothetical protein